MNEWAVREDQILRRFYGKFPVCDIATLLGRSVNAVYLRASGLRLSKPNPKISARRRYKINENFFTPITTQTAYWAGLIAADGTIEPMARRVKITLDREDAYLLEWFASETGYTGRVEYGGNWAEIRVAGVTRWLSDLRLNFNIVPRKTFLLEPPSHLSNKLALAFLCGYFDGDGSAKPLKKWGREYDSIDFCGNRQMMEWAKEIFDRLVPPWDKVAQVTAHNRSWRYRVNGRRATAIYALLEGLGTPRIQRKRTFAPSNPKHPLPANPTPPDCPDHSLETAWGFTPSPR